MWGLIVTLAVAVFVLVVGWVKVVTVLGVLLAIAILWTAAWLLSSESSVKNPPTPKHEPQPPQPVVGSEIRNMAIARALETMAATKNRTLTAHDAQALLLTPARSSSPLGSPSVGLIIRPIPLENILSGKKTWEMRSRSTTKREAIALIEKGGKRILGVARIVDVKGPLDDHEMRRSVSFHAIELNRLSDPEVAKYRFAWVLSDVYRFPRPVPYSPKSGAVQFAVLGESEIAAVRVALSGRTV